MALLDELERLRRRGPALLARLERLTGQLQAIVAELETTLDGDPGPTGLSCQKPAPGVPQD